MRQIHLSYLFTAEELDDIMNYCYQMIRDGLRPAQDRAFLRNLQSYLEQYHRRHKAIIRENLTLKQIAYAITKYVHMNPDKFSPVV